MQALISFILTKRLLVTLICFDLYLDKLYSQPITKFNLQSLFCVSNIQGGDYVPVRPFEAVNEAVTEGFF